MANALIGGGTKIGRALRTLIGGFALVFDRAAQVTWKVRT